MKQTIANLLRKVADRLSPEILPLKGQLIRDRYDGRELALVFKVEKRERMEAIERAMLYLRTSHYTPQIEALAEAELEKQYRERIKLGIFKAIEEKGLIQYKTNKDPFSLYFEGRMKVYFKI